MGRRDDFLTALRRAIAEKGTQAAFAHSLALHPSYINDVLHGRRAPGSKLLRALGFAREIVYRNGKEASR